MASMISIPSIAYANQDDIFNNISSIIENREGADSGSDGTTGDIEKPIEHIEIIEHKCPPMPTMHMVDIINNKYGTIGFGTYMSEGSAFTFPEIPVEAIDPTRTFLGYGTSPDGEAIYQPGDTYIIESDMKFYIISELNQYNLNIRSNNSGAKDISIQLKHGDKYKIPNIKVASNKKLKGLSDSPDGKVIYKSGDEVEITSNTTLYIITSKRTTGSSDHYYKPVDYNINILESTNGNVYTNKSKANTNDKITITIEPDKYYTLGYITVTDESNNKIELDKTSETTYEFTMKSSNMNIKAWFVSDGSHQSCGKGEDCPISRYDDTIPNSWYHDGLHYSINSNIITGIDSRTLSPNTNCTRAMLIQILWNIENNPGVNYLIPFKDIETDAWYTEAVRWAASNRIVSGYSNDTFGPNDELTREQLILILYNYLQFKQIEVKPIIEDLIVKDITNFTDHTDISSYAQEAINWAYKNNIVTGTEQGLLVPKAKATRAQVATIIQRIFDR